MTSPELYLTEVAIVITALAWVVDYVIDVRVCAVKEVLDRDGEVICRTIGPGGVVDGGVVAIKRPLYHVRRLTGIGGGST